MEIGEISKGKDKIIVSVKEFKGRRYVDLRVYFENENGEWIPTKKGITFPPESLEDMIKLLENTKKNLEK
ncbi:MAG: transcriptional coactivator p15/PC4 family protein [Syntrophorhabdaceae bacterium]|nr:transcriptional coactivator p15/PC4 family protein [Syntrophorhabdaceae bacterium]